MRAASPGANELKLSQRPDAFWFNSNWLKLESEYKNIQYLKMFSVNYCQISNIRRSLVANNIVDHSDVVGASPVGAAPTTSSFSTQQLGLIDWAKGNSKTRLKSFMFWYLVWLILEILR